MSRFLSKKYKNLTPYVPGEQPRDMQYVKLNTNESPFSPSEEALAWAKENTRSLNLYSDPEGKRLREELAKCYNVDPDCIMLGNGSDELLNYAIMAFCDEEHPLVCPDITYGFYPVIADLNLVPLKTIPLKEDFSINPEDYYGVGNTIFIANPNAPTGMLLSPEQLAKIAKKNPDNILVIDEAYIDFGGDSSIPLTQKYDNVAVIHTFSKSRSMAGGRLGYVIADKAIIRDLNTLRNSNNPYNINSLTEAVAIGILKYPEYTKNNCDVIISNRSYLTEELEKRGFSVLNSYANFVFAKAGFISGEELYKKLKSKGVLVRHFAKASITDYVRITVGTKQQLDVLLEKTDEIMEGR